MNARDEIVDFLVEQIPTSALANFQPSKEARQRVWELIAREIDAGLLPEEQLELDDYMKLEHLLATAKAKAGRAAKLPKRNPPKSMASARRRQLPTVKAIGRPITQAMIDDLRDE